MGAVTPATGAFTSLSVGTIGYTIDDNTGANQIRLYTSTAGKSLWVGAPGGITLNNNTSVTGTIAGGLAPRCVIPASAFVPGSTSGASLSYVTSGMDKYELQYSDGSNKIAYATLSVPFNYSGGNILIKVYWYISSGTNSQVRWEAYAASVVGNGAVNSIPTQVSSAEVGVSTGATSGVLIVSTLTWSTSLPAAGSLLYFGLQRATTSANDTSTASANVQAVAMEFGS